MSPTEHPDDLPLVDLPPHDALISIPQDQAPTTAQDDTGPTGFAPFKRLYQLASLTDKLLYLLGMLCCAGSGAITPVMTLVFGRFVTIFTDFALGQSDGAAFRGEVNHYTLYFIYLFAASFLLNYTAMALLTLCGTRLTSALRLQYLRAVLAQDIPFHEATGSSGALSVGLASHCAAIQSGLADKLALGLQCACTVVAAFAVAIVVQWRLALVTATVVPATVVVVGAAGVFDSKLEKALNETNAAAAGLAEELLGAVRTVRALGAANALLEQYQTYLRKATTIGTRRAPLEGAQTATYMFMVYGAYALAFWYGVRLYAGGAVASSGDVVTTLFAIVIGTTAFAQLAAYLGPFLRVRTAAAELLRVVDRTPRIGGGDAGAKLLRGGDRTIVFESVRFSYPLRPEVPVLRDFSLTVPDGRVTALVGPSGSGKSSIVALLERWYDISSGTISIGGVDIRDIPLEEARRGISVVQQEPFLFNDTILQNVLYGLSSQPDLLAHLTDAEKQRKVEAACKLAHAHDFIQALPQKYHTPTGDRGSLLSGGQKQRIALARALISDPALLILDEATSALDPAAERAVQAALDAAVKGRTSIVIAHRLSTVRRADKIVVLGEGGVVEEGAHEELAGREGGAYRRLLEAQRLLGGEERVDGDDSVPSTAATEPVERVVTRKSETKQQLLAESGEKDPDLEKSPVPEEESAFQVIARTFREQSRYWPLYSILFVCSAIAGAVFPLQAFLYAKLVDVFQLAHDALVSRGDFWALMFFVLALVEGIAYLGLSSISSGLGEATTQHYRGAYLTHLLHQPMAFFDTPAHSTGRLLAALSTDPDTIKSLTGPNVGVVITVLASLLGTSLMALAVGWKLALVALAGALPPIFFFAVLRERLEHAFEETAARTFAASTAFASECVGAIRTVSALAMEGVVVERFGRLLEEHKARARTHALRAMVWFGLSESVRYLCMALTFWYGGRLLSFGEYSTTAFFMVFVGVVLGAQTTGLFFAHAADMSKVITAARAMFAIAQSQIDETSAPSPHHHSPAPDPSAPVIEFRGAHFAYPTRPDQPVLRGLDLKVYKGQFVAIVGPSGCGKSTIVQLLERFYPLTSGTLLLHGVPTAHLPPTTTRRHLSLVPQEPTLFSGTIRSNITLGLPSPPSPSSPTPPPTPSSSDLTPLLDAVHLTPLIASLPQGLDTPVGPRGAALSGGQRQRVALARALARADADVLVLDEATSALDSAAEKGVQEALRAAVGGGRTVVAIAHRLSTIQHADVICVLRGGVVAEQGSHRELLARRGLYWQMCEAQALGVY